MRIFHWRLSDSKSPNIFLNLQSIFTDFCSTMVCMASSLPPISHNPSLFFMFLETVLRVLTTIGIMFHGFFSSLSRSNYLLYSFIFFLLFFFFFLSTGTVKSTRWHFFFFWFITYRFDLLIGIWWSLRIWKSQRNLQLIFQFVKLAQFLANFLSY